MFWRLAINGVQAAGGHDIVPCGPCPCAGSCWHGPPSEQPHRQRQKPGGSSSQELSVFNPTTGDATPLLNTMVDAGATRD